MIITKEVYNEIEEIRKKMERFRTLKQAGVLREQYEPVMARYEEQYKKLKAWIVSALKMVDWDTHIAVKCFYFYGLTVEEISEYVFFGTHTPEKIQELIAGHFEWLKKRNAQGHPKVPCDLKEQKE